MINISRLQEILNETTAVLRKSQTGQYLTYLDIPTELWSVFPAVADWPDHVVDCQFAAVGVNLYRAAQHLHEFTQILARLPQLELLREGPSYRHFIPYAGSELNALRFIALGDALGLWNVSTPQDLAAPAEIQDDLALMGLVCISGYPSNALEEAHAAVS